MQLRWLNNEWYKDSGYIEAAGIIDNKICQLVLISESTVEICSTMVSVKIPRASFLPTLICMLSGMPMPKILCETHYGSHEKSYFNEELRFMVFNELDLSGRTSPTYYLGYAFRVVMFSHDQLLKLREIVAALFIEGA